MAGFELHLNPDLDEQVGKMPEVLTTAMDAAEAIAAIASSTAPALSGAYAASIVAQKTKRGARVFASDYKSAWIEFGVPSRGVPAKFNLRNAVKAAGLKFRKKR